MAMAITITLHRFESDPNLQQRDGVNLAHTEINRLLDTAQLPGLEIQFHDFDRLLRDRDYAIEKLSNVDCVLCNVGPHGHYYFYLRHTLGLNFRIVRDIKTALWSSYLLQESLCQPYLREGDALLATSNYSRVLTRQLFPHLRHHPIALFEPVLASLPETVPPVKEADASAATITLGYVGRLSEDKNFPQVVDLLVTLNREQPGRYRLVACGAAHSASCAPQLIAEQIAAATGREDLFTYLPPIAHEDVVPLIRQFDYFVFFSTSNLEVLGRVLIEAAYAGVPILAARHAAAPELLDSSSLIDVCYQHNQPFYGHFDAPLGSVDVEMAAALIRGGHRPATPPQPQVNKCESLLSALHNRMPPTDADAEYDKLTLAQQAFVDNLSWEALSCFQSEVQATAVIDELRDWFCALNGKCRVDFQARLAELEQRSRFKERTRRFMATLERTRGDFTNVGGIDIELCNIANYHPRFTLKPALQQQSVLPTASLLRA